MPQPIHVPRAPRPSQTKPYPGRSAHLPAFPSPLGFATPPPSPCGSFFSSCPCLTSGSGGHALPPASATGHACPHRGADFTSLGITRPFRSLSGAPAVQGALHTRRFPGPLLDPVAHISCLETSLCPLSSMSPKHQPEGQQRRQQREREGAGDGLSTLVNPH